MIRQIEDADALAVTEAAAASADSMGRAWAMPLRRWSELAFTIMLLGLLMLATSGCGSGGKSEQVERSDPPAARASLPEIRQLISSGKTQAADLAIRRYLIRQPNDPQALILAAQTSHALGSVDQAVTLLDSAAELMSPQDGRNLIARAADLLAESGRWEESIERLERLLAAHGDFDAARHSLAAMLNSRGFRFDANQHVRELCRRGSATIEELRGLIWPSRAYATFATKPNIDRWDEIERAGTLSVARGLFGQGDVRDALTVLERSELIKNENPSAFAFYGQVLLHSQQFDKFSDWLGEPDSSWERYPAYWIALGGWALHQRRYDSAVRMYAEAVLREPGDVSANAGLTQALSAAGRTEAASKFRERNKQINQLRQIAKRVLANPDEGPAAVSQLSDLLGKVGRPLEALAWHRYASLRMGASSKHMQAIAEQLSQVVRVERQNPEHLQQAVLCGLTIKDLPLDDAWVLSSGSASTTASPRPESMTAPESLPASFVNVAAEVGLDFQYRNAPLRVEREFRIFQAYGAGVACLDYDRDGRVDFYLGQASGEPPRGLGTMPNQLSRNLGRRFHDVTDAARCDDRGYTCGVTSGDWNQDGFPDLVVGNIQRNSLLINQGDGTFCPRRGDALWDDAMYTTSLAMGDVDGDHLPDIVEVNYLDDARIYDPIKYKPNGEPERLPGPLHFQPAVDRLFLSSGDGSLRGRLFGESDQASPATGLGVLLTDIDNEIGNEVFVANDLMPNHLWRPIDGVAEAAWEDVAVVRGVAYGSGGMPLACMGIAACDFDGNGWLDLHLTNFEDQWSNQYMQSEDGVFVDQALPLGLDRPSLKLLGFGAQAIDYDNNSTVDLIVGNGHVEDHTAKGSAFEMPTQLFAWQRGAFQLMPVEGDPVYWNSGHLSRALAKCDWNNDGSLDVVITDLKQPLALLENRTATGGHWLQLELVGTSAERDAIGALVEVTVGQRKIKRVVQAGDGYMSKNQALLTIGLAGHDIIERIDIRWPDGERQTATDLAADKRWLIVQGERNPFALRIR